MAENAPAIPNQLATIAKLCRLLNIEEPPAPATKVDASELISYLCRRYNERPQFPETKRRQWDRLMESDWVQYMESRA